MRTHLINMASNKIERNLWFKIYGINFVFYFDLAGPCSCLIESSKIKRGKSQSVKSVKFGKTKAHPVKIEPGLSLMVSFRGQKRELQCLTSSMSTTLCYSVEVGYVELKIITQHCYTECWEQSRLPRLSFYDSVLEYFR